MPLTKHTGELGTKKAAHLLRRCSFNVTPARIRQFAALTANQAVDYLFHFSNSGFNVYDEDAYGDYIVDGNGIPTNFSHTEVGNSDLMFSHGPLWQYDGALMHPTDMGASDVKNIGTRNWYGQYFPEIAAHPNANLPSLSPFVNGCANNEWQNCNYVSGTYLQTGVYSWRMYEAINDTSIRWKLVFWINSLFTTAKEREDYHYPHWKLMYDFVNGVDVTNNFVAAGDDGTTKSYANSLKALAFVMTYSNEMLLFLDNNVNFNVVEKDDSGNIIDQYGANENYAREFLELFTILKGEQAGPEDYTNYTEQDVVQAAKVLTGFRDDRFHFDSNAGRPWGKKVLANHNREDKTFSAAFGLNTIHGIDTSLPNTATEAEKLAHMDKELWDFIHMVFNQDKVTNPKPTAYSFAKRMYRYFVSDQLSDVVIEELANELYAEDTNQKVNFLFIPVLKKLLKSRHFYADASCDPTTENCDFQEPCNSVIGSKLKSPLELLLTSVNLLDIRNDKIDALSAFYNANKTIFDNNNGFVNAGARQDWVIYFKTNGNLMHPNHPGAFLLANDPGYPIKQDGTEDRTYLRILFGIQTAADFEDNLHLLYQHLNPSYDPNQNLNFDNPTIEVIYSVARNHIRKVFHEEIMDVFYVPLQLCGFDLKGPDTVEGYRGYYKEENYSKNWLDSSNFHNRYVMGSMLVEGSITYKGAGAAYPPGRNLTKYEANLPKWVQDNIDYSLQTVPKFNPDDPKDIQYLLDKSTLGPATEAQTVVSKMLTYFLAEPPEVGTERFIHFEDIFLSGLSPEAWEIMWLFYIHSLQPGFPPADVQHFFNETEKPLKNLCNAIMQSHEFQIF